MYAVSLLLKGAVLSFYDLGYITIEAVSRKSGSTGFYTRQIAKISQTFAKLPNPHRLVARPGRISGQAGSPSGRLLRGAGIKFPDG